MNASPTGLLLLGLVGGAALGYGLGQALDGDRTTRASNTGDDRVTIANLTSERDEWKKRALAAEAQPARMAMGEAKKKSATSTPGPDGMSGPTKTDAAAGGGKVAREKPDPEKAAKLLTAVQEALVGGDAKALEGLLADVTRQGELLVPDLVGKLAAADSLFAKEQLAKMLGEIGDPRALDALQTLLRDEADDAVRTAAVRALGAIPDESSVDLLTKEFRRPTTSPMPPSLAATSLGNIGSEQAIAALKSEIEKGGNGMVRAFALNALAARNDKALAPFFLGQAKRKGMSDRYRRSAIDALVATGDQNSIYELRQIALSPESSKAIQEAAKRAVNKLSGKRVFDVR